MAARSRPEVTVIGAGVAGLSCAVVLAEAGFAVHVVAAEPPAATVSAIAGGLWFPYRSEGDSRERTLARSRATYARYEALAGVPEAGVALVEHLQIDGTAETPWWAPALPPGRLRPARAEELPPGVDAAHVALLPLVQSPLHLEFLAARARALGASFAVRRVASLDELGGVVVNCAGLGAGALCGDAAVSGLRGQVVHLRPPPGRAAPRSLADDRPGALTYLLPRPDVWVAGGTAEPAREAGAPDPAVREAILARCAALVPAVAEAEVIGDRAGLRPVREGGVRLEAEPLEDGGVVVHDYGHGGAGWTLAWGCALEVRALLAS